MVSQYEFTAHENDTIKTTGSRSTTWGVIAIVVGVLQMLLGGYSLSQSPAVFAAVVMIAGGAVGLVVGLTFLGVGKSLKGVVETQGNDVALMMSALQKLTTAFTIQIVVTVIGFVVGFVAGAAGLTR